MSQINLEPSELEIKHEFGILMQRLQEKINISHSKNRNYGLSPELTFKKGRVYWKLIKEQHYENQAQNSKTVYAFIRRKDGAIFRAATWKQPETRTKSPIKGYITDEWSADYFTAYGVAYEPQD